MNAQRLHTAALAAPAILAFVAGAATACPPETESGEKQPLRVIELGSGQNSRAMRFAQRLEEAAQLPMMSVFAAKAAAAEDDERTFFVQGQPGVRVQLGRPAQTALTEQNLFIQAQPEPARARGEQRDVLRLRGAPMAAPTPPALPTPPVPPAMGLGGGGGAQAQSQVIIIGPDGKVQQFRLDDAPARIKAEAERRASQQPFMRAEGFGGPAENRLKVQAELERAVAARRPAGMWVGIEMSEPDAAIARYFELEPGQSTQIARVFEHSPAAKVGLQSQDIIVGLNGERAAGPMALSEAVAGSKPGDKLRVTVLRKGQERELTLRPEPREQAATETKREQAAVAGENKQPARADLERRMDRIERMLERLLEEKSHD